MSEQLKTWPAEIYLQHGVDGEVPNFSEIYANDAVTWCLDQINPEDVKYVRADSIDGVDKCECDESSGCHICCSVTAAPTAAGQAAPTPWDRLPMASVPHPNDIEKRVVGFVIPNNGADMPSKQLAEIIGTGQAASTAPTVPEGFALVPIEPTPEMERAGNDASAWHVRDADDIYRAMLSAAPSVGIDANPEKGGEPK